MKGVSDSVCTQTTGASVEIMIGPDEYRIGWAPPYKRAADATDTHLKALTDEVLATFKAIERIIIHRTKSVHLDPEDGNAQLIELARLGRRAYQRFFKDEAARQQLSDRFQEIEQEAVVPAPTFISDSVPFPWEVLYEGDDYHTGDSSKFWGFAYSPARIINLRRYRTYPKKQTLPSDMLFCLHHKLQLAHRQEWPEIERLVKITPRDRFYLLGQLSGSQVSDGEAFLGYLDQSNHNMLHFACHCRPCSIDSDSLLVSLLNEEGIEVNPQVIELETNTFTDIEGSFQRQPLVFLNACQSAGGSDEWRKTFNLPSAFIERGAAAIIATACPVPDIFAAAFAKVFYEFFLRGQKVTDLGTGKTTYRLMTIGEALRATRWYFLREHNNPLGLAYGLYSPTFYQLEQPLIQGGSLQ